MKWRQLTACLLAALLGASTIIIPASACTAVYVGADASNDGTLMIARSNDHQSVRASYIELVPGKENEPGRKMPVNNDQTVFADLPATTYKYTTTPWMDSTTDLYGSPKDAACAANEHGVAMTMSVTSFANSAALAADPLVEDGLTEFTANDLVICQSKSAAEAVGVLLALLDQYGSSECNIAIIADQTEAWYVEIYTGYQYAAVKLPSDKVAVFGNEYSLESLADYPEHITSDSLITLAEESGFAVYDANDHLNLLDTYSGTQVITDYSHMRTWIGHRILSDNADYAKYSKQQKYPLLFSPNNQVSLQDVMEIMRNRFEGTEYDVDATGRVDMRVIGTDTSLSTHILQIYPNVPADMSCVTWASLGPPLCGIFVPVSNFCTGISEDFGRNQPADEKSIFDTEHYPYYAFKELCTLGLVDYKVYGTPVREYWHRAESNVISSFQEVIKMTAQNYETDPNESAEYVTGFCNSIQTQAFADAKMILNTVKWMMSSNSNTMKLGRNPETNELLDTERVLAPITISMDSTKYSAVPEP